MINLPNSDPQILQNIQYYFQQPINSMNDINALFFKNKYNFVNFLNKEESSQFLKYYNYLRQLVFQIDNLFPEKVIPILKTGQKNNKLELTRKQVALLFLLSFFKCIKLNQDTNFNIFCVFYVLKITSYAKIEKTKCFINYLIQIGKWLSENNKILDEKITYIRDSIEPNQYLDKELCEVKICESGSLFDGKASYCIDFANKYIGGGVLDEGNVQEEILFTIEPEAIVSLFFMEVMGNNDAIGIYNTIQYSNYNGYGEKFKFNGSAIPNDITKIKKHKIIAIDAINLSNFL